MAFVRVKRVYGSEYAYLVANSWTERGGRQKVAKYLGKVHRPEKAKSEGLAGFLGISELGGYIHSSEFRKAAADLVKLELHNHDVKSSDFTVDFENFTVKNSRGKEVAIAMNQGFLCGETLRKLLEYDAEKDYSGYVLADVMTAAGIAPEKDVFISLYGKFKQKQEAAEDKASKEFYY